MKAHRTMTARGGVLANRSAGLVAAGLLVAAVALTGCDYIVPPIDFSTATP
jgi:hypothetical protein